MLDPALAWIDEQSCPFFLGVLTLTPHHDYGIPDGFPATAWSGDENLNNYLNTVAYVDRFVGKLFAGLEARGLIDNTIFVVAGDHGEGFGEHGRTQHDSVIWEEGLRVPLIVRGPGIEPGSAVTGLRQLQDIPPTILRMLDLEVPTELDGLDLFTSLGHERVFASCWPDERCMAMIEGNQKVIDHYEHQGEQMFVLDDDPLEENDVASVGENPAYVEMAVALMRQWRDDVNARYDAHGG
jgi:arylsulfatase A-like enzyme